MRFHSILLILVTGQCVLGRLTSEPLDILNPVFAQDMNGNDVGSEDPSQAADMGIVEEEEVKVDPSATALGASCPDVMAKYSSSAKDIEADSRGKANVLCFLKSKTDGFVLVMIFFPLSLSSSILTHSITN